MIVCIDPDDRAREGTREALAAAGFDTRCGGSRADAADIFEAVDGGTIEGLVTEYDLPDGTGIDLVSDAREVAPDLACVLFTDTAPDESVFETTVVEYLPKDLPGAHERLVSVVRESISQRSQAAYPLPDEESARLDALEQYEDADALAPALDRLTELARLVFGVASAGVGLIDAHHQRFPSCSGASFGAVDREETVCTYAILEEEPMVVEDLREDPRFGENETLAGADVRFYAGIPLVTAEGHAIGTLCLHDDEPRSFSDRERTLLSLLADEVMDQLRLRRRLDNPGGADE